MILAMQCSPPWASSLDQREKVAPLHPAFGKRSIPQIEFNSVCLVQPHLLEKTLRGFY